MPENTTEEAVAEFLRRADDVYDEYERGYANADATLRKLQDHIQRLEESIET